MQQLGISISAADLQTWQPTAEALREVIQAFRVFGTGGLSGMPLEARAFTTPQDEVEMISAACNEAIMTGRLIDFGTWSNDLIILGGNQGGPLYSRSLIGQPFREPWLFVHRWEPIPGTISVTAYLVVPLDPDDAACDVEAIELQPVRIRGSAALMISDRARLFTGDELDGARYHCAATPSPWRFIPEYQEMNEGKTPAESAAGNVLDPLMTALLILATPNLQRETIAASDKLQKARAKSRKPPIPPYQRVNSGAYITALADGEAWKSIGPGRFYPSTHASPVAHLRRGHTRVRPDGRVVHYRDCLVNSSKAERDEFRRSHYAVKGSSGAPREKDSGAAAV